MHCRLSALLVLAWGLAVGAVPAIAGERTYSLPGSAGALTLPLPDGWSDEIFDSAPDIPPTIKLTVPGREATFAALVTPVWPEIGAAPDFGTPGSVRRIVESSAAAVAPEAVEHGIEIRPFGGGRTGFHFFTTDRSLVGRTPPPGEYRYMTQGALMVGRLLCTFTLLTNENPSGETRQAIEMLRGAAHRLRL